MALVVYLGHGIFHPVSWQFYFFLPIGFRDGHVLSSQLEQ